MRDSQEQPRPDKFEIACQLQILRSCVRRRQLAIPSSWGHSNKENEERLGGPITLWLRSEPGSPDLGVRLREAAGAPGEGRLSLTRSLTRGVEMRVLRYQFLGTSSPSAHLPGCYFRLRVGGGERVRQLEQPGAEPSGLTFLTLRTNCSFFKETELLQKWLPSPGLTVP